jgi:ATP-dependent DNA helicase RecQ
MSCTASQLARVAQTKPKDIGGLTRLIGDRYAERFGQAFLDVLQEAS